MFSQCVLLFFIVVLRSDFNEITPRQRNSQAWIQFHTITLSCNHGQWHHSSTISWHRTWLTLAHVMTCCLFHSYCIRMAGECHAGIHSGDIECKQVPKGDLFQVEEVLDFSFTATSSEWLENTMQGIHSGDIECKQVPKGDLFQVKEVLDRRRCAVGRGKAKKVVTEYLVWWTGFGPSGDTLEPESNLSDDLNAECAEKLKNWLTHSSTIS